MKPEGIKFKGYLLHDDAKWEEGDGVRYKFFRNLYTNKTEYRMQTAEHCRP